MGRALAIVVHMVVAVHVVVVMIMTVVVAGMAVVVRMIMVVPMAMGLALHFHLAFAASAYIAHHTTSSSLIRISSPPVTCSWAPPQEGQRS